MIAVTDSYQCISVMIIEREVAIFCHIIERDTQVAYFSWLNIFFIALKLSTQFKMMTKKAEHKQFSSHIVRQHRRHCCDTECRYLAVCYHGN